MRAIVLGASLLAIVGGAIGVVVGGRRVEAVDAMKEAHGERLLDEQINRVLNELWRMEDLERPRSRR